MKKYCLLFLLLQLGGCTSELYHFGHYSESLYSYKREPNNKTQKAHVDELKDIIEESNHKGIRVPPGIYCEYAYMLIQQDQKDEALQYIKLEESTYPESHVFTTRLMNMLTKSTSDSTRSKANPNNWESQ